MKNTIKSLASLALVATLAAGCAGGAITTREKGIGIGALGGATAGGLIGTAVRKPLAGAMIGAVLGAGAGGLIGDGLQGREIQGNEQDLGDPAQRTGNLAPAPGA